MNLVSRTTEYPNGTKITETFQPEAESAPYDQAATEPVTEDKPFEIHFSYDGLDRVVQNPQIIRGAWNGRGGWNVLLGGVETYRDGEPTGEYKNFSLNRIHP